MQISLFLLSIVSTSALRRPAPAPAHRGLDVRGGDGISVDDVAKVYSAFYSLNGIVGMPAPEAAAKLANFPEADEGTTDYVIWENVNTCALGYGLLVYLAATQKSMATSKMVAYAGVPCAYATYKNWLKGVTEKLSGSNVLGPGMSAFMLGSIYCLFKGKGNTDVIAKVFAAAPLVIGVISKVSPETGMKMGGMGEPTSEHGKAYFMWWTNLMVGFGALALMLLDGRDAMKSIGYVALLDAAGVVDNTWMRKFALNVAPTGRHLIFFGVPLLTAAGILLQLDQKATTKPIV